MALTDLLLMGRERDLTSERGVSCAGELPAASDSDLVERARAARAALVELRGIDRAGHDRHEGRGRQGRDDGLRRD